MTKPRFSKYVFWGTIAFLFLPLLVLGIYSFNSTKSFTFTGFSLRWYEVLFSGSRQANQLWLSVQNSFFVASVAAGISTVIGTLGAIGINWYRFKTKAYLQTMSFIPLVLPEAILGVGFLVFFSTILGLERGMVTILLAHISFTLPFVILMVLARLSEFDYSIIEAARDLGAKEHQILTRVILPISMPGVISGFLTSFILSLEDFVVTLFVKGGSSSDTLPIYVFNVIRKDTPMMVAAFSVFLILFTVLLTMSVRNLVKYIVKSS